MRKFIVTDIKVNGNESFNIDVPSVYAEYPALLRPYVRTFAVETKDITFEYIETSPYYEAEYTYQPITEPHILDLLDQVHADTVSYKAWPMAMNSCIVSLSESDLRYTPNISQAIFEKLQEFLVIEFFLEPID